MCVQPNVKKQHVFLQTVRLGPDAQMVHCLTPVWSCGRLLVPKRMPTSGPQPYGYTKVGLPLQSCGNYMLVYAEWSLIGWLLSFVVFIQRTKKLWCKTKSTSLSWKYLYMCTQTNSKWLMVTKLRGHLKYQARVKHSQNVPSVISHKSIAFVLFLNTNPHE